MDEAEKFGATEKMFELKENNLNLRELLRFSVERTQNLFNEGKELFGFLDGRLKYEIIWTVRGGEAVLNKIRKNNFNVLRQRPSLSKTDFLLLLINAILKR